MHQFHHKYSIIILFLVSYFSIGCQGVDSTKDTGVDSDVVYSIGDSYKLTFDELHAYAQNLLTHVRYDDMLEGYTEVMYEMVGNQYKRFGFFDKNLHEKQELLLPMQRHINEELITAYFNQEFLDKYLTDAFLRDAHENMQYEVRYRKIVLFDSEHDAEEEQRTLEEKAGSIVEKYDEGENFTNLVRTYSQHEESRRTGGYTEPATWRRSVMFPVDSVVFGLQEGEIEVIRHENAYYIVEATDRILKSIEPFEEMEEEVKQRVKDAYTEESLEEYDRFLESLVKEESLQWNEEAFEKIFKWARQPNFFGAAHYRDVITEELEQGNNFEILSYNDGTVDLEKYLYLLDYILIPADSPSFLEARLKDYFVSALREMKVGELAKEAGLLDEIFTPVTRNWIIRNEILIAFNNHIIASQIPDPTEDRLRSFYEEVKDSLFYQLRTVHARIIDAESESRVEELKSQFEAGTPFTELAHRIQVRVFYRDRDGNTHVRNNRSQPELEDIVIELEQGEVVGPVTFHHPEKGTVPALVWANRVLPEKQLSFYEVSDRIESKFREHHRDIINERVISDIRDNYESRFYKEHLVQNLKDRGML